MSFWNVVLFMFTIHYLFIFVAVVDECWDCNQNVIFRVTAPSWDYCRTTLFPHTAVLMSWQPVPVVVQLHINDPLKTVFCPTPTNASTHNHIWTCIQTHTHVKKQTRTDWYTHTQTCTRPIERTLNKGGYDSLIMLSNIYFFLNWVNAQT